VVKLKINAISPCTPFTNPGVPRYLSTWHFLYYARSVSFKDSLFVASRARLSENWGELEGTVTPARVSLDFAHQDITK